MSKIIALAALMMIAAPAFAGPATGVTASGAGVAATPWRREPPRETRPYALTGTRDESQRSSPKTRTLQRLGNNKVEIEQYR